jgi:hypothetical protein
MNDDVRGMWNWEAIRAVVPAQNVFPHNVMSSGQHPQAIGLSLTEFDQQRLCELGYNKDQKFMSLIQKLLLHVLGRMHAECTDSSFNIT